MSDKQGNVEEVTRKTRRRRGERGQALVEFGLVSIVFFLFVFGIFDAARMFESWMTVQHAARESARYGITGRATCEGTSGREQCIVWTAKNATTGISRGGPDASSTDVNVTTKSWDYQGTSWTGPTAGAVGKSCDQIEVTVTYNHRFTTPLIQAILPSGVNIHGIQRMTNEPFGPCEYGDGVS